MIVLRIFFVIGALAGSLSVFAVVGFGQCFDLFNHANFGQPGNMVGSPNFGRITSTRFPTGESGSSRQLQFALKFLS